VCVARVCVCAYGLLWCLCCAAGSLLCSAGALRPAPPSADRGEAGLLVRGRCTIDGRTVAHTQHICKRHTNELLLRFRPHSCAACPNTARCSHGALIRSPGWLQQQLDAPSGSFVHMRPHYEEALRRRKQDHIATAAAAAAAAVPPAAAAAPPMDTEPSSTTFVIDVSSQAHSQSQCSCAFAVAYAFFVCSLLFISPTCLPSCST
jgi:hypothetical protein